MGETREHCRVSNERVQVGGYLLNRITLHPTNDLDETATMLFFHGQGDHALRYKEILWPFTQRGIRCIITDMPGHGYSPGVRGHSGDLGLWDEIVQDAMNEANGKPYGIGGHSMGGLLAARHLVLAEQGKWRPPAFAWLSSALLKPSLKLPSWQIQLIRWLAPLVPQITFATGVTRAMCEDQNNDRAAAEDGKDGETEMVSTRPAFQPWHGRISLGWADCLLDVEEQVADAVASGSWTPSYPLLLTHGGDDPVCPPSFSAELAQSLRENGAGDWVTHFEMEGLLHEPFAGSGGEQMLEMVASFLTRHVKLDQ